MAAMRGPNVVEETTFAQDREALREKYPELDGVINELKTLLTLDYLLPGIELEGEEFVGVHARALDYPPKGADGLGVLLVTFHASPSTPSMSQPLRTYTLLSIIDLAAPDP